MGSGDGEESRSLDAQIMRLQKSTRTVVPAMLPLHDILRSKYRWYYKWALFPYSKAIHSLILIVFLFFIGAVFYRFWLSSPNLAFAATSRTVDADIAIGAPVPTPWNTVGTVGAGYYDYINETVGGDDGDTTYLLANSTGTRNRFSVADFGTSASVIQVTAVAKLQGVCNPLDYVGATLRVNPYIDTGSGPTALIGDGGVTYEGDITVTASADYATYTTTFTKNSGSWTNLQLSDMYIDVSKESAASVCNLSHETGTSRIRLTQLYITVMSKASVTTSGASTPVPFNQATLNGNITSVGSANVTRRGVNIYSNNNCTAPITWDYWQDGNYGTGTYAITTPSNLASNTTYSYKAYAVNEAGTAYGTCSSFTTGTSITLSGTSNAVYNGATLEYAINGVVKGSFAIGNGTFSGAIVQPSANQTLTVWVDGATTANETTAVIDYAGAGNVTGMELQPNVLTVGATAGDTAAISSASLHFNASGGGHDADTMMTSVTETYVSVEGSGEALTDPTLKILSGTELQVGPSSPGTIEAHNINIVGTLTATATSALKVSGTWTNSGTFNKGSGTVTFDGAVAGHNCGSSCGINSGSSSWNNVVFDGSGGTWTFITNAVTISGNFSVAAGVVSFGTLSPNITGNLTMTGGTLSMGTGTTTVSGDVDLTTGTFNRNTSKLIMNGSGKSLAGGGKSLNNFEVAANTKLITGNIAIYGTITVDNDIVFTVQDGRVLNQWGTTTLTNAGSTITADYVLPATGTGYILAYDAGCGNIGANGHIILNVYCRAATANITVPYRTNGYEKSLILQGNNTVEGADFTATIGTAGGQTFNIGGEFYSTISTNSLRGIIADADTWDPTMVIGSNVRTTVGTGVNDAPAILFGGGTWTIGGYASFTSGNITGGSGPVNITGNLGSSAASTVNLGSSTWTVGGDVNLAFMTVTGGSSKIVMTGAKTLTGNNQTINNLQISNAVALNTSDITVGGTLTVDNTRTFTINSGRTLTQNGAATLTGALQVDGTLTPAAGIVVGGGGEIKGSGTAKVTKTGDNAFSAQYTVTTKTLGSLTVQYAGAGAQNISAISYGPLEINNGGQTATLVGQTSCGKFTILSNAIFNGGGQVFNVSGDFANSGTFTANGSTVNLTGGDNSTQIISGNTTFNSLSVSTDSNGTGRTIQFADGSVQNIASLNIDGNSGKMITLTRSGSASAWTVNPTAATVAYAVVSWSNNTGAKFCSTYSDNGGNNGGATGWYFDTDDNGSCSPGNLSGVTIGSLDKNGFTVTGDDVSEEDGYKIWISTAAADNCSAATYPVAADYTLGAGAPSQAVAGKSPNTRYCAKMQPYNSFGNADTGYSSPTYTVAAIPSTPAGAQVVASSWTASGNPIAFPILSNSNPNGTNYYIQAKEVDTADCGDSSGYVTIGGGDWTGRNNNDSITDYRTADKFVCYRIKARNFDNFDAGEYSTPTTPVQAAPAQPTFSADIPTYAPTITTNSITWDWSDNPVAPQGYRLYNSGTNDEVCSAAAPSGCTQTQSTPGNNLQANVAYSVKAEAYRGTVKGQPSAVKTAYTAIEDVSGITWGDFTTDSLIASPSNTPSNLNSGSSGIQYANTTKGTSSAWQQNSNAWTSDVLSTNTQYTFTIQSKNGDGRTTTATQAQKYTRANPPSQPGNTTAVGELTTSQIKWTWNTNSNPVGTEFYVSDTSGGTCDWTDNLANCALGGKNANTSYTATIKSRNGDNVEEPHEMGQVVQKSAYTAIETPTTITSGLITPNSIALNISDSLSSLSTASSGIQYEETSGNTGGGGEAAFSGWPQSAVTNDIDLKGAVSGNTGTTYKYKIKARNGDGIETAQSPEFEFTTTAGTQLLFKLPGETLDEAGNHLMSYSDSTPDSVTAGVPFNITIYAADGANFRDLSHQDTIALSSASDPSAEFPVGVAMANGQIVYNNVIFKTVGNHTITGLGSGGSSHEFSVSPGTCSASASTVSAAPASLATGATSTITVHLKDAYGNALSGHSLSAGSNQAGDNFSFGAATTDATGKMLVYITSATAHASTVTLTDTTDVIVLDTKPVVTFTAAPQEEEVDAPTNFAVTGGNAKATLTWTNPASFDHINIYRSLISGSLGIKIAEKSTTRYVDNGLSNATTYYYTLKAEDDDGNLSDATDQLSVTPQKPGQPTPTPTIVVSPPLPSDTESPTVPTNLRSSDITDSSIDFIWDASTDNVGVEGYEVYNADTNILIGQTVPAAFSVTNLNPETAYRFKVRAFDKAGNYSDFSQVLSVTTESNNTNDEDEDEEGQVTFLVLGDVPKEVDAGKAFPNDVRLTIADAGGIVINDFDQAVYFSSTDNKAELGYNRSKPYTFTRSDAGVHIFGASNFSLSSAGKQKLSVSDFNNSSTVEITVKSSAAVAQTLQKAGEQIKDFFSNPSNVSKVNTGVVTATALVLLAPVFVNTLLSLSNIIPQLTYWFFHILELLGLRKKRKPWGVVFNSQTGQPVPLAVVRIYEKRYNRMLEQVVTDNMGRYGFLAREGSFYITVSKSGFTFPPKEKTSSFYEKVYAGNQFNVSTEDQSVAYNIPVDPQSKAGAFVGIWIAIVKGSQFIQKLGVPLLILGFVVNIVLLLISFKLIYLLTLVFYALFALLRYMRIFKARPYGIVTDNFNHPLGMTIVRIYRKDNNRLIETDVSDQKGRFKFLVAPGVYYIMANKPGYIDYKSHLMYLQKEKTLVSTTIKLKKVEMNK